MKYHAFQGTRMEIFRIVMAVICLLVMFGQIKSGMDMIAANNNLPPMVDSFENLENDSLITGVLTRIDGEYIGDSAISNSQEVQLRYLFVVTENDHILVLRVMPQSEIDQQINRLRRGLVDKIVFKGKVSHMTDTNIGALNMYLMSSNYLRRNEIKSGTQRAMLRQQIDITTVTDTFSDKAITFTFIGAVLMFLLSLVFLRKLFKNLWYNYLVKKGLIEETHLLDKKDYTFENEGLYTGADENNGEFFVNTEHNVRNEGTFEQQDNNMMTHFTAAGDFFYEGGVNEEGNFYVDENTQTQTVNGVSDDPNSFVKRY